MSAERRDALILEAGSLRYTSHEREVWRFTLEDLIVAGEWTDDHGPYADDYFYLFIAGRPAAVFEAPMYANPGLLNELGTALRHPLHAGLAHVTTFQSRILWPGELAGNDLFSYSPERRKPGLLNRALDWIVPVIRSELTAEVAAFVKAR